MTTAVSKVIKSGNSAVVVLPSEWRKKCGVSIGDELVVMAHDDGTISFAKKLDTSKQVAAVLAIGELCAQQPKIPWEDESKEGTRVILAERYV